MKYTPLENWNSVSRRTMLVFSGVAVAAGAVTTCPLIAIDKKRIAEHEYWKQFLGKKFRVEREFDSGSQAKHTLTLVGVEPFTRPDPNRPAEFRTPFSLIFVPDLQDKAFKAATYYLSNPDGGQSMLFMNETLDFDYSDSPVVQACFC